MADDAEVSTGFSTHQGLDVEMSGVSVYQHWRLFRDEDNIAWLEIDKAGAGTNVLSSDVVMELDAIISELEQDLPKGVVIRSAKDNGFIAGADIHEFLPLKTREDALVIIERGQRVMDRIAELRCPTVAVIHGFALGGGFELALACRYRIAEDGPKTKVGLPEVRLGIHPGFGGTLRLPKLTGAPVALDMMLTGRTLSARAARKVGCVDYAVPERQLLFAARQIVLDPPQPRLARGWRAWTNHDLVRPFLAMYMRRQVAKKARREHYPAPYRIIDLWARYTGDDKRLLKEEADSLASMVLEPSARNLIRVFFLQEKLKSLGKQSDFAPRRVHVIGAGVMGGDIAAWCAYRGYQVTLQDRHHENIARVRARACKLFRKRLKDPRQVQAALDRLQPDLEGLGLAKADVVVEAVFEDVQVKRELFRQIEPQLKDTALITTNTSSIPLEEINTALSAPQRLVGLHFFNPVEKMMLIEIVKGPETDPKVAESAAAFARRIDRLPLPVTSTPGFLVNRVLMPYLLEAVEMEQEGVPVTVIDEAALKFGMPMGPIHLADVVGLDICLHVAENVAGKIGATIPERLKNLVNAGYLGRKSGRGFYTYRDGQPQKPKVQHGYVPAPDLGDRLIFRMLNECVACWREGVVDDAELVDAGVIFGTGFAPFRGGPINYIRESGVTTMRARLNSLEKSYGARFQEDPGWADLEEG